MDDIQKYIISKQLHFINAQIDLDKPDEALKLTIPGYQPETFDLTHAFYALSSIFKLEIPFIISDLLHLVKYPIFYKGLLAMKMNGQLCLLHPTTQSLYIDLQNILMLSQKNNRSVIEKEFFLQYYQCKQTLLPNIWSPYKHLINSYALHKLKEKANNYIACNYIDNKLNNNRTINLLSCRRWKRTLKAESIKINKRHMSILSYIKLKRSLEKFECEKFPSLLVSDIKSNEIVVENHELFEISVECKNADQQKMPLFISDTVFDYSINFMCFIISCQAALKRLQTVSQPPELSINNTSFKTRFEIDDMGQHWMVSINPKYRALASNAKFLIGNEFVFNDYLLSLIYTVLKNGCSILKISIPKDKHTKILSYYFQTLIRNEDTCPEISILEIKNDRRVDYLIRFNCLLSINKEK